MSSDSNKHNTKHRGQSVKLATFIIVVVALIAGTFWYSNQGKPRRGGPPGGFGPVLVVAEPVGLDTLVTTIEALGTAKANQSVTLAANLTDTVRRVNFDDGDFVKAGTVLVEMTNEEEEAQLAEARANLEEAQRQFRRLEDLDRQGIAATSDVDQARAEAAAAEARLNTVVARLEDRLIRAPFSGLLGFRDISPGTLLQLGEAITTLDDIVQIKLDFSVPETALGRMQPGRKILARSAATREREYSGTIRTVGSRVDPVTRAANIRAIIDNKDRALRPGMLMTVRIVTEEKSALVVPERSVVQTGDRTLVYVIGADMKAEPRRVTLGMRQAGHVEVTAGLTEGESIVTEGVIKMRPGVQVRLAGDKGERHAERSGGRPPETMNPEKMKSKKMDN